LRKAHDELEQQVLQRTSELQKSEEKYRTLVETIPHGIEKIDTSGVITFGNAAHHAMLGYEPGELLGKYIWDLLANDLEKDQLRRYLEELVESQPPPTPYVQRNLTKQGEPIDVQVDWSYERDETGKLQGFVSVITDITEHRKAAEKLEAEGRLLRELLHLHELERKLVVHEIHDGIVQDVVGAKMHFETILRELTSETPRQTVEIERVKKLLTNATAEGRRLISELRPMVLDEEGIVEAIKHLVAREYSGPSLKVELLLPDELDRLDPMLEGAVFRIAKEALTNVKLHSRSETAIVSLGQRDRRLLLEIRDRGVGFDPEQVPEARFGLRGIRERARLFGGHASIESTVGQGSCITVELPVVERTPAGNGGDQTG
jgi:PAS domain S-box-containing protein